MGALKKLAELSFLSKVYAEKEIEGRLIRFYSPSVGCASKMREFAARMVSHVATLWDLASAGKQDQGQVFEEQEDKKTGFKISHTSIQAVSPELADKRAKQRAEAVEQAIMALLDPKNHLILGELLIDSMRDEFPKDQPRPSTKEIQDWVAEMDIPTALQFILGLLHANAKRLEASALGKAVLRAVKARTADLTPTMTGQD